MLKKHEISVETHSLCKLQSVNVWCCLVLAFPNRLLGVTEYTLSVNKCYLYERI